MSLEIVALVAIILLFLLFTIGVPVAFSMALVGFIGFAYVVDMHSALRLVAIDTCETFASYGLTVVPLFILMGQVAFNSGIAKRLFDAAYKYIGHVPGGLAMATVVGATAFKAICGSSPATAATFSLVAVPEMDRYGYSKKLSTGIVSCVGTLGVMLPPSVTLIIFGIITDQSIGRLFLAGICPGLLISAFFVVVIYGWCKIDPTVGPKGERTSWSGRLHALPEVIWVGIIFCLMIGGILKGFFTPTEAGSVGTILVLILTFIQRDMNVKGYIKSVKEASRTAVMVLVLICGSTMLGHFIAVTKIPMIAADWIVSLPFHSAIIIFFIVLIYLIGGSFIDDLAFMILATPIFFPAISKLGYNPLWFGIMICITVMIGVVIPPVAMNVFVVKQITKVPFGVIYAGVYPFLISLVLGGIAVFLFPGLATWLPGWLMPG